MDAIGENRPAQDAETGHRWLAARLPPSEMRLLDTQGFVSHERLPSGTPCAKLRFRGCEGRQRVVYLGVGPRLAEQVAAHLAERQAHVRRRRALHRLRRQSRRLLRQVKPRLAPHVEPSEWHFHGRRLRRKRRRTCLEPTTPMFPITKMKGLPMIQPDAISKPDRPAGMTTLSGFPLDKMRRWAHEQDSPFDVAVGLLTADLCDLAAGFAAPLKAALQASPADASSRAELADDARLVLQVARQAERCLRLAPRSQPPVLQAKNSAIDTDAATAMFPPSTATS